MKKLTILLITIATLFLLSGCIEMSPGASTTMKTFGFDSPDEFLNNSDVIEAQSESNFYVNQGTSPPYINGIYSMSGIIVDANISGMTGMSMASIIEFYNQSGTNISLKETVGGQTAYATGSFILGNNEYFTVFQEAELENPYGEGSIRLVALMSGEKLYNGDIDGKTLTIITEVIGIEGAVAGGWYKGDVYLAKNSSSYSEISRSLISEINNIGILASGKIFESLNQPE